MVEQLSRDITKLSEAQQRAIVSAESPEIVGMAADLLRCLSSLRDELLPLREAMRQRAHVAVPAPLEEYLKVRSPSSCDAKTIYQHALFNIT